MEGKTLKVLLELQTEVELFNFLALVNEVELYGKWIKMVKESQLVAVFDRVKPRVESNQVCSSLVQGSGDLTGTLCQSLRLG